jgi:hypothetical protein
LFSSFLRISFQSVKGASLRQHGNFILFVCACGSMAVDFLLCLRQHGSCLTS